MTIREKIIIMAYTQISMFPKNSGMFHYYREYVEEILGRPIVTRVLLVL